MSAIAPLSKIQPCKDLYAVLLLFISGCCSCQLKTTPIKSSTGVIECTTWAGACFIFLFIRTEHPIGNWNLKCSMIFKIFFSYLGGALHAEIYSLWNSCVEMNGISCQSKYASRMFQLLWYRPVLAMWPAFTATLLSLQLSQEEAGSKLKDSMLAFRLFLGCNW